MPRECVFYVAVYSSSDRGGAFWMGVHFRRDRPDHAIRNPLHSLPALSIAYKK